MKCFPKCLLIAPLVDVDLGLGVAVVELSGVVQVHVDVHPPHELHVEESGVGDVLGHAQGEAAPERVVVLRHHVAQLTVASRVKCLKFDRG